MFAEFDYLLHSDDPKSWVIGIAGWFSDEELPMSLSGYRQALVILRQQHSKGLPDWTPDQVIQIISDEENINDALSAARTCIEDADDYRNALQMANILYVYGEVDLQESVNGEGFLASLTYHRELFEKITRTFADQDPLLKAGLSEINTDLERLRQLNNEQEELVLMRGIIHTVAVNRTLGIDVIEYIDPYALFREAPTSCMF